MKIVYCAKNPGDFRKYMGIFLFPLWKFTGGCAILSRKFCFSPETERGCSTVISFFTDLFRAEQEVREYWQKERWRQTKNIAILSIALFLMMSVMNLYQRSYGMLLTTLTGAIALFVCLLAGRRRSMRLLLSMKIWCTQYSDSTQSPKYSSGNRSRIIGG